MATYGEGGRLLTHSWPTGAYKPDVFRVMKPQWLGRHNLP